jgi:Flp pilus assembly protein TadD
LKRFAVMVALAGVVGPIALHARLAHADTEDDLRDGDKYFEDGEWKRAAVSYDRAIAKAPSQVAAAAYGQRAAIYIILKDYAGGLAFIAKAEARYPAAPEILAQKALMLWETDKRDEAIKVAEQVVAAAPKTFTNQKLIGEYYASRDPQRTVAAYEAYFANRPQDLEAGDMLPRMRLGFAYLGIARAALGTGDNAAALTAYGKAAEQFELVEKKFAKKPNAIVNADNGLCGAYTGLARYDRAVTVCEQVVADPKHVDSTASPWFNLATSYLARKQTKKARAAATEFTRVRKQEPRGFMLIGDTYFADREWPAALEQYLRADKLVHGNQAEQTQLSIRLGKTYRRLPAPATGPNPNLLLAIDKLSAAMDSNPTSLELALELGSAYLEARQDGKATLLTDRLIANAQFAGAPADGRARVLELAGKALYNEHKLREARARFESAVSLRPGDVAIQRELVETINEQAFEASAKDPKLAQGFLDQALALDPSSPTTITNLAVLALDRNECDAAQKFLGRLRDTRGADSVIEARLLARSYLCSKQPDVKKASEQYAIAEREAKKAQATAELGEIYTEWAPLLWDTDLADAVDKLELAVQATSAEPEVATAAKRNLALALFRRGWKSMREGKAGDASTDFERAARDPSLLRGTEPLAFDFSYALALLDAGRATEAAKLFRQLATKGNQAAYLRPPYTKIGNQFFSAFASYKNGTLAARQQAAAELAKLEPEARGQGAFAAKLQELLASCWELIALDQWRAGQVGAASRSLATAKKYATGDAERRLVVDRAALGLDKAQLGPLEGLGGNPPEALVDLGIVYDLMGKPKEAYDAWTRAKARGVQNRDLQRWIDAKKRIYGFQ